MSGSSGQGELVDEDDTPSEPRSASRTDSVVQWTPC